MPHRLIHLSSVDPEWLPPFGCCELVMNLGVQMVFGDPAFSSSECIIEVQLLDHLVILFSFLQQTAVFKHD